MVIAIVLLTFGATTVLQGRATPAGGPIDLLKLSAESVFNRLGGDAAEYQFQAIRLLHHDAPVYGDHWLRQLMIALPGGSTGLSFDEQLHGLVFSGNTGGNQPLDIWGATYYNWGVLGAVLVPFLYGYALQSLTIRRLVRTDAGVLSTILVAAATYRLALASDPYSLLLQGGMTLLLFEAFYRHLTPKTSRPETVTFGKGKKVREHRRRVDVVARRAKSAAFHPDR